MHSEGCRRHLGPRFDPKRERRGGQKNRTFKKFEDLQQLGAFNFHCKRRTEAPPADRGFSRHYGVYRE
jgi:hypothetical protein